MRQSIQPRILVIEDDLMIATDLSEALGREGYRVVGPVAQPDDAIELISRERPDYAIVDINLNGAMSFSVADSLADSGIPFLFASGYGPGLVPARHSGVPFFEKPLRAADLLGQLTPWTGKPAREGGAGTLNSANLLLQALEAGDAARLRPHLQRVLVRAGQVVEGNVSAILLPESGLAYARLSGVQHAAALALVGHEGMLGAPFWRERHPATFEYVWLTHGEAVAVSRGALLDAMERSPRLAEVISDFTHALLLQVAWTAQANAGLDLLGRLSRTLAMAADRLGPQIAVTHMEIAAMLQVRRAGVTEALHKLEGDGAIRSTRCLVTVRDRELLGSYSGDTCGPAPGGRDRGEGLNGLAAHSSGIIAH